MEQLKQKKWLRFAVFGIVGFCGLCIVFSLVTDIFGDSDDLPTEVVQIESPTIDATNTLEPTLESTATLKPSPTPIQAFLRCDDCEEEGIEINLYEDTVGLSLIVGKYSNMTPVEILDEGLEGATPKFKVLAPDGIEGWLFASLVHVGEEELQAKSGFPGVEGSDCIPTNTDRQVGQVADIADGDTIGVMIDGQYYEVRYIGMDTPEMGAIAGDLARNRNFEFVVGKEVLLVKDVSETDDFNRLLRYVIADEIFINYQLIKEGYAVAGTYEPDTACNLSFRQVEEEVRTSIPDSDTGASALVPPQEPAAGGEVITGNIVITSIFFNGKEGNNEPDEYVIIRNDDTQPIQLQGWTLVDNANHNFYFPSFVISPGQECRIYTNQYHPNYCGFSFGFSSSAIWNNDGDCAYLRDRQGNSIFKKCY